MSDLLKKYIKEIDKLNHEKQLKNVSNKMLSSNKTDIKFLEFFKILEVLLMSSHEYLCHSKNISVGKQTSVNVCVCNDARYDYFEHNELKL